MVKIVWRFNLRPGVEEGEFFAWLREHVWASSARYGCSTTAFKLDAGPHRYSTEAIWPSDEARKEWAESESFRAIPNYPGTETPWGAQQEMEAVVYRPL